ncbi:hypothetical protein VMCG_00206 [Cytospora schulzeri]|uniref:Uncharacterized protein n=1 Tax=Cytospora schulzeri TaxID=448051 RepID=A0A423X8Z6_9PEZI|nr:hypothetical protein VMCG_00206 [Valsa malicola]
MDRLAIRRVIRTSGILQPKTGSQLALRTTQHYARFISLQPRVAETSFWKQLIPKPLRWDNRLTDPIPSKKVKSKEWNPATFFIIIFLLIGSMSIQMISLRKNFEAFMRRSDVRIGLLREVVEKIQNGENVDVEKVLGAGDPEREAEWEEVLSEIEKNTASRNQKKQEKANVSGTSTSSTKFAPPEEPKTDPATQPAGKSETELSTEDWRKVLTTSGSSSSVDMSILTPFAPP